MRFVSEDGVATLLCGDCLEVLDTLEPNSLDSVVCDPPYHLTSIVKRFGGASKADDTETSARARAGADGMARLSRGFMGKEWDGGDIAFRPELWAKVLRVLKPGGYVVAFSGTRTYHRMACAIEDAGFDVRDQLGWIYGQGFPKSLDISKAIDKTAGVEREVLSEGAPVKRMIPGADQAEDGWEKTNGRIYTPTETAPASEAAVRWHGWGTALKPAWEPICLARKPIDGTNADNVLKWGVGALNIDGCRVEGAFVSGWSKSGSKESDNGSMSGKNYARDAKPDSAAGRWPANILHDGSDEVLSCFPGNAGARAPVHKRNADKFRGTYGAFKGSIDEAGSTFQGDSGSAARFFYCAKANKADRADSKHPTVKPVALMRWLCRLVTPPGGIVLDPFAGSGTTGQAAVEEGFRPVLIEREAEYQIDIRRRLGMPEDLPDFMDWPDPEAAALPDFML